MEGEIIFAVVEDNEYHMLRKLVDEYKAGVLQVNWEDYERNNKHKD